ncbi:YdcF family protein [Clostridiaceae bacterium M8S5]|nr:YdcF family protein [Clostridiaceae bacterium M8S5]
MNIKKAIRIILMILSVLILLNGVFICFVSNFNLGNITTLLLGIVLFAYTTFYKKVNELSKNGVLKWLRYICIMGIVFMIGVTTFIVVYGKTDTAEFNEDAVVVLGCGIQGEKISGPLYFRLIKTVEYYSKNKRAIIIVSGGQGPEEDITEAEAMKKYLVSKGIPKEKIYKEEKATSTYTNFKYSKAILDDIFDKNYTIAYITNNYHSYRAGSIAKELGLNARRYNASVAYVSIIPTHTREFLAVLKHWVIGR